MALRAPSLPPPFPFPPFIPAAAAALSRLSMLFADDDARSASPFFFFALVSTVEEDGPAATAAAAEAAADTGPKVEEADCKKGLCGGGVDGCRGSKGGFIDERAAGLVRGELRVCLSLSAPLVSWAEKLLPM